MQANPSFEELYAEMEQRSGKYDGIWFTAVKTTKIFCRPVCPARTPLARNVEFFPSAKEALHAGYRACKRCKPLDMGAAPPAWVEALTQRLDAHPEQRIRDQNLREMGLDPATVRRTWIQRYGFSFHAYQRARRMGVALAAFRAGADPVDAAMKTDYGSESGFRAAFEKILGVPPKQALDARPALSCWIESPLGPLFAVESEGRLALLEFIDRRMLETQIRTFQKRFGQRVIPGEAPVLEQVREELKAYFSGHLRRFETPLDLRGTPFQESVWRALLEIPYGETRSYGALAQTLGNPGGMRAVAKANGDNRLGILVPCHRVIGADGSLTGYGGGVWRKQRLLDLESGAGTLF